MSTAEILALCIFAFIALSLLFSYLLHGRKVNKKQKLDKKPEVKIVEEKTPEPEQKPVPVGIIKKENVVKEEDEIAPFKDVSKKDEEHKLEKKTKEQSIQDEIKSLSPEMKKVIMSDILKPKF